jgi:LEA14-like dessication related protein
VKSFNFSGYIDKPDLGAVGRLVSTYLNGKHQELKVEAQSIDLGSDVTCKWLVDAFRKCPFNVSLPGEGHKVIRSINFSGVAITKGPQQVSSGHIIIGYQNPFEFPITVTKVTATVNLEYDEKIAANFTLKDKDVDSASESRLGTPGEVHIKFEKQVLKVSEEKTFKAWRTAAAGSKTNIKLSGEVTVVVNTDIGKVTLSGLRFSGLSSELQVIA